MGSGVKMNDHRGLFFALAFIAMAYFGASLFYRLHCFLIDHANGAKISVTMEEK